MCENSNAASQESPGASYRCYGPELADSGQPRTDAQAYSPWRELVQEMYRVKEYGLPSTGYSHPPLVRPPPSFVQPLNVNLPNRFVNELYTKYPFLIPKCIKPEEYQRVAQRSYTVDFEDLTTYQEAYGNKGLPEAPELVEAKGLSLPEPEQPSLRLPGVPYTALCRRPLAPTDAVDLDAKREDKKASEKILQKIPALPKRISEYEDNINILARYWKKHGLYTEASFYVPQKPTLPKD